ncbi:mucin-like protein isoform X2 [Liolophura sinensis]|uniref:mucin-like protein isoform X2 n=1 Tax=Liolophura sinensis TaxID=3198878 RepID=UPI0031597BF2
MCGRREMPSLGALLPPTVTLFLILFLSLGQTPSVMANSTASLAFASDMGTPNLTPSSTLDHTPSYTPSPEPSLNPNLAMDSSIRPTPYMEPSSTVVDSSPSDNVISPLPSSAQRNFMTSTTVIMSSSETITSSPAMPEIATSSASPTLVSGCASGPCQNGGNCTDEGESFNCSCPSTWTGLSCETDVNECNDTSICAEFAQCSNTDGGYECLCSSGFKGDGMDECEDVNECINDTLNTCGKYSDCRNTNGSFECDCQQGTQLNQDMKICEDINECQNETLFDCPEFSECENTVKNYTCKCITGYVKKGDLCEDINECETATLNDCHRFANCTNNPGNFTCQCKAGFSGDGHNCIDVDDCTPNPCKNEGTCGNSKAGHFKCICPAGWRGGVCETDIDECKDTTHDCSENADCKNLNGSHSCTCHRGYHGDGQKCTKLMLFEDKSDATEEKAMGTVTSVYGPFQIEGIRDDIFVHMNGYLVIGSGLVPQYPPSQDELKSLANVYAPFWSSIDTSAGSGKLLISLLNDQSDRSLLDNIGLAVNVTGSPLRSGVMATWHKVSPLPATSYMEKEVVTFQVVVVTNLKKSWVIYNYDIGNLTWNEKSENRTILVGHSRSGAGFDTFAVNPVQAEFKSAYNIDKTKGNKGEVGRFVIDGPPVSENGACLSWYFSLNMTQIKEEISKLPACPCTREQARLDGNFYYDKNTNTAHPWFEPKQHCKYDSAAFFLEKGYPGGGYPNISLSSVNQAEGWAACCEDSHTCHKFYEVFPSDDCSGYQPPTQGISWGDPHVTTFHGTEYTFNGLGEFVLWKTDSLEIQCRTARAQGSSDVNATEYVAFAMKADDSSNIEVRYKNASHPMEIAVDGKVCRHDECHHSSQVIVIKENAFIRIAFASGVNFKVTKGIQNLGIFASIPTAMNNGQASGLMAMTDSKHFRMRNGTLLPMDSSEESLYLFGTSWQVFNESDSLFNYSLDFPESHVDFNPKDFMPTFYREMGIEELFPNDTVRAEAQALCGNNTACLVDFAATGNIALANKTKQQQAEAEEVASMIKNMPPVFFNMPDPINLVIGEELEVAINAYDNDTEDSVAFLFTQAVLPIEAVKNETDGQTYIKLTPHALSRNTSIVLKLIAEDGRGGADIYWPEIHVCACRDKAECLPVIDNRDNNAERYYLNNCNCQLGYRGDFCMETYDVCAIEKPCYPGVNCTTGVGQFECGPCPEGLSGNGSICYDVNECLTANDCEHEEMCRNLPGSYSCGCRPGFTLDENKKNCTDDDECLPKSPCQFGEYCDNLEGGYECKCKPGYFNRTGRCEKDENIHEYNIKVRMKETGAGIKYSDKLKDRNSKEFSQLEKPVIEAVGKLVNISEFVSVRVESFEHGSIIANTVAGYRRQVSEEDINQAIENYLNGCSKNCLVDNLIIENITVTDRDFCLESLNDCHVTSTKCHSFNGTFRCECREGYKPSKFSSSRCDDIDECATNKNDCGTATCVNSVGTFTCHCENGKVFEDKQCVDKCHNKPCKNGGSCLAVGDTFACKCSEDWTGPTCEEEKADHWKKTLIIVASVLGSLCLIALLVILICCCRMRQTSKAYSGVSMASGDEAESSVYQGWSGKIPRPRRTPNDSLEMVENGSRTGMDDPSKPLTAFRAPDVTGHENPSFAGGQDGGQPKPGRTNEYF